MTFRTSHNQGKKKTNKDVSSPFPGGALSHVGSKPQVSDAQRTTRENFTPKLPLHVLAYNIARHSRVPRHLSRVLSKQSRCRRRGGDRGTGCLFVFIT